MLDVAGPGADRDRAVQQRAVRHQRGLPAHAQRAGHHGAAAGAGIGNGNMCGKSIESMARQPEEAGKIFTNMLVCVGLIESMPILCYVIAIVLVFANPFIK